MREKGVEGSLHRQRGHREREREGDRNSRREKQGGKGERKGAFEVTYVVVSDLRLPKVPIWKFDPKFS